MYSIVFNWHLQQALHPSIAVPVGGQCPSSVGTCGSSTVGRALRFSFPGYDAIVDRLITQNLGNVKESCILASTFKDTVRWIDLSQFLQLSRWNVFHINLHFALAACEGFLLDYFYLDILTKKITFLSRRHVSNQHNNSSSNVLDLFEFVGVSFLDSITARSVVTTANPSSSHESSPQNNGCFH
jgi:hypothetical protein